MSYPTFGQALLIALLTACRGGISVGRKGKTSEELPYFLTVSDFVFHCFLITSNRPAMMLVYLQRLQYDHIRTILRTRKRKLYDTQQQQLLEPPLV